MMIPEIKKTAEHKMSRTIETLVSDLGKVRTGRAHTGIIDHTHVDYYGMHTPISQVATIALADPRTIAV
ncbi:MAG: ribosome recycling factor, partial [Burkholderiales bacterium]|nr:ribosome recycling factor [Burkholderiales bacterium]